MAEFGVEWQSSQAVARTQGTRMCIIGRLRSNDLLKHTGTARGTDTKEITQSA